MSDTKYPILRVSPHALRDSPHQPPGRSDAASNALNALAKSIQQVGLQYPPLVTRDPTGDTYTIVDGHRRVAAMRSLAWQDIPVLVSQGKPAELFSAVCGNTKPVTAAQWIEVYLRGGDVPSGPTKVNIRRIDEVAGRDYLQRLSDAGLSPQIWNVTNRVIRYAGIDESLKDRVLNWLLDLKITRNVAAHISGNHSPHELSTAFDEKRVPMPGA